MKTRNILAIAMVALMSVVACKKVEHDTQKPAPEVPEVLKMNFTASLYEFTKATDTAFENGDVIGVNVFNPECYLYNAKYTYNNGALTAAVANEWYEDTELEATITAVYPCTETTEGYAEDQSFMVNADQSAKAGYAASDLMLAVTKSKPTADAVKLPFKHALSKIVVTVDNKLGEEISQLWFTDVLGSVTYKTADPFATLAATGSAGTVKAYKSGNNTWQLIVAPQTASPKLALTTASGKQFTFVLSENVTFTSGKVSTATVEVSTETIYTSFTPEIEDWVADNELNFSQDEEEVVLPEDSEVIVKKNVIYLQVNNNWASDGARFAVYSWSDNGKNTWTDMTDLNGDWIYTVTLPDNHTSFLFCRMNPSTTENRWNSDSDTDETKPVWNQSIDYSLPVEGNCFEMKADAWDKNSEDSPWDGTWKTIAEND